jgi:hypothetical protein
MNTRWMGAVLGLVGGYLVGAALQNIINGLGISNLAVIVIALLAALLGANVAGLAGALIGAVVGALIGGLAVGLIFWTLKLVTMAVGAGLGWRWGGRR